MQYIEIYYLGNHHILKGCVIMGLNKNDTSNLDIIDVRKISEDFIFDIRYASDNNFVGRRVYTMPMCALRRGTAIKLVNANKRLMNMGYRIKIYDGYRPLETQKLFWNIKPDDNFVANPYKGGSIHNRGCAVDVTLVDINSGNDIEMPSEFDDFTEKAGRSNNNMGEKARKNLELLTNVMLESGFDKINSEWWHYTDCDKDKYNILDISFEEIANTQ